ncbi:MAG: beta strand repeat-containing protein [Candidatus Spyradenecus sp.]
MKPTSRSALGFAVACFVGVATAAPTAQWIDFTGGTANDDGSTSFSIEVSGWTLTATGTKNADGSVTLSSAATLSGTGTTAFSVILDCSKPAPSATSRLLSFAISSTETSKVGFLNCSSASVLQLGHGSGTGTLQTGTGSTYTLDEATRQFITLTHNSSSEGTYIYVDKSQALAWSGLKWNGQTYPHLTVGFNGLTVYGIYLYSSRLANATAVSTELDGIVDARGNGAEEKSATVEAGSSAWSSLAWDPSEPTAADKAILTATGESTITVAENEAIDVVGLTIADGAPVTFSGAGRLSVSGTATINADTDFADLATYLCTVSVDRSKTLTLGANTTVTSFTTTVGANLVNKGSFSYVGKNSALSTNPASLRVMEGTVTLPSAADLSAMTTAVTVDGGATLNVNGIYNQKSALTLGNNAAVTNGGSDAGVGKTQWKNLTLSEASASAKVSGNTFGLVASSHNAQPMYLNGGTLTVAMNADKTFYLANVYAKKTASDAANSTEKAGKIKVESGTLNLYKTNHGTGNNANTLSLSRVEVELAGGEVALGESGTSRIGTLVGTSGSVTMGALALEVGALGEDSTFGGVVSGSGTLTKVGSGTLTLTGKNTNTGSLTISAGAVRFAAAEGAATVGSWAGAVTVGAVAALEVPGTSALPTLAAASAGTVLLTGNGELDMRSAISTASALTAGFAEGTTGSLIVPAGNEAANLQVPSGATLKLVLSEAQLAAGSYTYSFTQAEGSTVSFWRADAEGNLTEVTGTTVGSTFLPTLSFVFTNAAGNGQWADVGNWSDGAVPSATDAVEIPANTTLTLAANVLVADLRVTGSGTLTVAGGTLTVTNRLLVVGQLAATSSQLAFGDNLVAIDLPEAESALGYTVTTAVSLPALTGTGTFTKCGSANMTFKNATTAYLAQVVVAEGTLDTGEIQTGSEFHITVKSGATFLTRSTTSLTSMASTLCLEGGAILDLRNGNGSATRQFQTAITVDATTENPAIIQGSRNGNNSNLQGAITGKGTLEIRKAPDQTDANAFTISGSISNAADGTLALKVTQTGSGAAVTLTGDNTYTGGTTIADGATVIVEKIGKLGPSGTVQVEDGGTLKLVNSATLDETGTDYSRVTGTGTVWYSGSAWRTLPNTAAKRLPTSISVRNDLTAGLIISQQGTASPETAVGSVSGSGTFRVDWNGGDNSRSLRIVQSKNTEHTGNFINSNGNGRLTKVIVAGADGATEKTLTLSGNTTTTARPLEIAASGSVKLTGSWDAEITINGALEVPVEAGEKTISTVLAGSGTLTKSGAGTLNLTGDNNFLGNVAITGGILNVGSNRGFTVSAIESGAKLALSPTAEEIESGRIELSMANGVRLSAEQLSVTDFPGVTGAEGSIYLSNPCWKPTAEDATWANNWYRGTTLITTVPTSGEIEVNFSALTAETEVTIPEGSFEAVTFVGGEAESCSLVVTLGEGVTLGALTIGGRVTLPDTAIPAATEVTAGATLSLAGSGATISTAITGAGSLCQRSGATTLTGVNTYTGTTTVAAEATLALAGEGVLSDAFGDGSAVIVNGTLELADGSYCRRTTGTGTIRVQNDLTFAIGQAALPEGEAWSADKTTGLTGFTGTLALVGNLKLTNAASAVCTYTPTGFNVRFEDDGHGSSDGQLLCDETGTASFTLAAGCSLSGKGAIQCPIAFEADSVIEVTMATNLDLSAATISLPSGEGEHILLKAAVASTGFLYPATSANVPASAFAFAEESTLTAAHAGVKVYRYPEAWGITYDVVQVLTNPSVPEGTADGVAEAVRDQAVNDFGIPVSVKEVAADTTTTPKAVVEGALFFENVVKTVDNGDLTYTAKVTYDFGVSAITVKKLTLTDTPELCVVVCAKVASSAVTGTAATFKESAKVQLYLNGTLCSTATPLTSAIDSSVNDGDKSVRWFALPLSLLPTTGTSNFTVKVTE